jgi:hypothetical protein
MHPLRHQSKKNIKSKNVIPFSWALLIISLLHLTVWSIGVHSAVGAEVFLVRETNNFKNIEPNQIPGAITGSQQAFSGAFYRSLLECSAACVLLFAAQEKQPVPSSRLIEKKSKRTQLESSQQRALCRWAEFVGSSGGESNTASDAREQ